MSRQGERHGLPIVNPCETESNTTTRRFKFYFPTKVFRSRKREIVSRPRLSFISNSTSRPYTSSQGMANQWRFGWNLSWFKFFFESIDAPEPSGLDSWPLSQ